MGHNQALCCIPASTNEFDNDAAAVLATDSVYEWMINNPEEAEKVRMNRLTLRATAITRRIVVTLVHYYDAR
jgi:hypothetical protein